MIQYTEEQRKVIEHTEGHALISAVAGSGKTQTMLGRLQYLLKQGILPDRLLVLMFNKSAKEAFSVRLNHPLISVKTFHALGFKIFRDLVSLGEMPDLQLVPEYQISKLIKSALKKTNLIFSDAACQVKLTEENIECYSAYLSIIKSDIKLPKDHICFDKFDEDHWKYLEKFVSIYDKLRSNAGAMTYDDLIYLPVQQLVSKAHLRVRYATLFDHILIDEYQDINAIQHHLVTLLAGQCAKVMVVGDVDQTIYEWRGSRPYYMLKGFFETFKPFKQYHLSLTFRYSNQLSQLANSVIERNESRFAEQICQSSMDVQHTTKVKIYDASSYANLLTQLSQLRSSGMIEGYGQVGVLVRKYSSSIPFELVCLQLGINYKIEGAKSLMNADEMQAIIGYLNLASGNEFGITVSVCENLLKYPKLYFKKNVIQSLSHQLLVNDMVLNPAMLADLYLPAYQLKQLKTRQLLWVGLRSFDGDTLAEVYLTYIIQMLKLGEKPAASELYLSIDYFEELLLAIREYARIQDLTVSQLLAYLTHTLEQEFSVGEASDFLNIHSIHRAKGLEWDVVILLDMTEKGFFGHQEPDAHTIEAERRLMYVAMTRARKYLWIVGGSDYKKRVWWHQSTEHKYRGQIRKGKSPHSYPMLSPESSVRFIYDMELLAKRR